MLDPAERRTGYTIPSEGRLRREMAGLKTWTEIKALCEEQDYSYYFTERDDDTLDLHIVCLIGMGL